MTKKEKKELLKSKEKKHKVFNVFVGFLLGMYLTVSGYLIYNLYKLTGIENLIRYIVMGVIILVDLIFIIRYFRMKRKTLLRKYIVFTLVLLIFGGAQFFAAYTINKGLNFISNISTKDTKVYKTSLIALKNGKLKKVSDITSETKIGRVSDTEDIENNQLSKYIMKKNKIKDDQIVDYDDPITLLYSLYENKDIDAAFVSGSYVNIYKTMEKFENIKEEVIELDKYSKKMKVKKSKETTASTKSVTEPFTILLMGVDSTEEDLSNEAGLGDSLMLITFNPKTLNATILSIPRDTFVPITCYRNAKSKITHAASGGDKCMISTIQNFFDVNIDYYAKINFRGLMKLVDALGGIDVDVPNALCETTMWRTEQYMVYVEQGMQHLNGEQALALSRNRKTYPRCGSKYNQGTRNDFVRGQNQQLVINAIMNKAKSLNNISQFYAVLDAVGSSMTTNMDKDQILSFYNIFKQLLINSSSLTDGNNIIEMQKMYLNGSGGLYLDGIMNQNLYEYLPSNQSKNAIINAMKVNLELKDEEPNKEFSFSADTPYEQKVIGKDLYGGVENPGRAPETNDTTSNCGENEELGADGKTCVCKFGYSKKDGKCEKDETKDDSKHINECVSEGGVYYWYDSNGDKNSTKYSDSSCSVKVDSSSGSGESGSGESGSGESGGSSTSGGESGGSGESGSGDSGGSDDSGSTDSNNSD